MRRVQKEDAFSIKTYTIAHGHTMSFNNIDNRECCAIILSGTCDFYVSEQKFTNLGERQSVFDGAATSVYIPINTPFSITSRTPVAEVALIWAEGDVKYSAYVIIPQQVKTEYRGRETWYRQVHDILDDRNPANALIVGETFSQLGVWSGYPPHKHDDDNIPMESDHKELYYVRTNPSQGFGIFLNYQGDVGNSNVTLLKDRDMISVTKGYHSIVAAAGYEFYYLWALVGKGRRLCCQSDASFGWLESQKDKVSK